MFKVMYQYSGAIPDKVKDRAFRLRTEAYLYANKVLDNYPNVKLFSVIYDMGSKAQERKTKLSIIEDIFMLYEEKPPIGYNDPGFFNEEFDRLYDKSVSELNSYVSHLFDMVYGQKHPSF